MRVKICCISTVDEARLAHEAGADLLGLVSQTLSGSGAIPDERIRAITDALPDSANPCLLTSGLEPRAIAEHVRSVRAKAVQLVGAISPERVAALRPLLPNVELIKVVHVEGPESVGLASSYEEVVDCLLLDSVIRRGASDSLGGTGQTHDWSLSRKIVDSTRKPVYLAGGLDPSNVESAISKVAPDGVDVCSGLREGGALVEVLLSDFIARATAT